MVGMTPWSNLTPQERNAWIAEYLFGWQWHEWEDPDVKGRFHRLLWDNNPCASCHDPRTWVDTRFKGSLQYVPDYTSPHAPWSLVAEVRDKAVERFGRGEFVVTLASIVRLSRKDEYDSFALSLIVIDATPDQICEAVYLLAGGER